MAVSELITAIPNLSEIINSTLKNKGKKLRFYNGLFINDYGEFTKVLGYDTDIKGTLVYQPTKNECNSKKQESIKINLGPRFHLFRSNYKLDKIGENLFGKISISMENPLELDVIISSSHLNDPPYQGTFHEHKETKPETSQELVDIVKEVGLEDKRDATDEERKSFSFIDMFTLLEWIKHEMRYINKSKRDYLQALRDREGKCEWFSEIFERMIYIAGGFSSNITNELTFNLPLEGWDYFSITSAPLNHALSLVYYEDSWHVVDSTIYNSTYHNSNIPKGFEKRAYSPMIRNYPLVYIKQPSMQLLERNRLDDKLSSELQRTQRNHDIKLKGFPYYYIQPRVDMKSVELLM